ncbi:MAG: hypothetical protein FJ280_06335 [Planctomycetes bacterium]|nr:hypothetical protein [Planctomycetota bacterium]
MTDTKYIIDLLKGEGVPIRSQPGGIAFACLIVVVPFLVGVGATSVYLDGQVVIAIQSQQARKLATAIEGLAGAVQKKEALEREKAKAFSCLSDVKAALDGRTQWSPILTYLGENLSETLVLTKLEARRNTVRYRVPARDAPARNVEANVPVWELRIGVCGTDKESSSEAVRKLQDSLRCSPTMGPMLDTITVSQNAMLLDNREAVLYELHCVCKPTIP